MIKRVSTPARSRSAAARSKAKPVPRTRARSATVKVRSWKQRVKTLFAFALLLIEVVAATALISMLYIFWNFTKTELPNIEEFSSGSKEPVQTTIWTEDGVLLARLEAENRHPITIEELGKSRVADATVAIEDHRFYEHPGVDVWGIGRAIVADARGSHVKQGASTLTQQLVRQPGMGAQFQLSSEKRLSRKIREVLVALRIEQLYTKKEIIQLYLNNVYYGSGAYGIQAASKTYFNKPASKLTLSEAAMLSGVPQNPNRLSPNKHLQAATKRRDEVLDAMLEYKKISQAEYDKAKSQIVAIKPLPKRVQQTFKAPWFTNYVLKELYKGYASDYVYSGLTIRTTLNWKMQVMMERALYNGIDGSGCANQGAMVAIDPQTGYIRGMVGGRDFQATQFNAVTQGRRQPGSTFKIFDYAAAFNENVASLWDQFEDRQIPYPNDPSHLVKNFGDNSTYGGTMTCKQAIMQSKNTIAVQVAARVGIKKVIEYAYKMGVKTKLIPVLPTALGASSMRPLDLCSAYSLFAANGKRCQPMGIVSVTDAEGNGVDSEKYLPVTFEPCLKPETVNQIDEALRGVVEAGTGMNARGNEGNGIVENAHGKTGTTSGAKDVWFAGYTPELTTVVWMASAHRRGKRMVYEGMGGGAQGGRLCAPVWHDFMIQAIPIQKAFNEKYAMRGLTRKTVAAPAPQQAPKVKPPVDATPNPDGNPTPDNPADNSADPAEGDASTTDPNASARSLLDANGGTPEMAKPTLPVAETMKPTVATPTKPTLPAQIASPIIPTERPKPNTLIASEGSRPHTAPELSAPRPRVAIPAPRPEPAMTTVQICGDSGGLKNPYCDTFKAVRMTVEQARKLRRCRLHKPPPGENDHE